MSGITPEAREEARRAHMWCPECGGAGVVGVQGAVDDCGNLAVHQAIEALPVDREALARALYVTAPWDSGFPPYSWSRLGARDKSSYLERAEALIASPVLRALAAAVWDEGCVAGNNGALHPRGEYAPNRYREQAR